MDTISTYPWHVNSDAPGFEETSSGIEENIERLIDYEQEHGALFYAGVANEAADMLEYPEAVKVEIPEEAEEAAGEFVSEVAGREGKGTAQALYGLAADAHDHLSTYEEAHGKDNTAPLDLHIEGIRDRVRER